MKDESCSPAPLAPVRVFWTGGFDSTARILSHVRTGRTVQPVYMRHSPMVEKSARETAARAAIRTRLGSPLILPDVVWDLEQCRATIGLWRLEAAVNELADALLLSRQYAALRFCRDAMDCREDIEVCIVYGDEAWERLLPPMTTAAVTTFFAGMPMPYLNVTKRTLWLEASPSERDVLRLTFSCEETDHDGRTCVERSVQSVTRCTGCKRRIEELTW